MVGKNIHNCLASTSSEQFQQFLSRRQHEKQPPVTLLPATILRPPAQPVQADLFIVDQPVRSHFDDAARSGIEFLVGVRLSEPQGTEPVQTTLAEVVPADPIHLGESAISPRGTPSAAQGTESAAPTTLASIPMEPLKVRTCSREEIEDIILAHAVETSHATIRSALALLCEHCYGGALLAIAPKCAC